MIVDKLKLSRIVGNILSLSQSDCVALHDCGFMSMAADLSNEFDKIAGSISFEENITNDVMSTNILCIIGNIKNVLRDISEIKYPTARNILGNIRLIIDNNPCENEFSSVRYCESCDGIMQYDKKFLKCGKCDAIEYNDTDNFNIDNSSANEGCTTSRSSNISKHLQKNLSHIYGESWPDKLPEAVSDIIIDEIRLKLPNLEESVHLTYDVHELLHNMRLLQYEGKVYKPKDYKIFTNSFIIRAFPEIQIPKLETEDNELLNNLFLTITAKFLDIITQKVTGKISKYNNNYLFTIHRILFMKLYNKPYIRKRLLRFIYIQNPSSFGKKDRKLCKVNKAINCFEVFYNTPADIYINERYY
jgi:hypothetical protein